MAVNNKTLATLAHEMYKKGRRLVAPLMGFPGLSITGVSMKLARQNYGEHYRVINSLARRFKPDLIFPLMDLSIEANAMGRYTIFPKDDTPTVMKDHFNIADLETWKQVNITFDSRILGYVETQKLMVIGLPADVLRGAYVSGPYSLAALIMGADKAAMATILDTGKLKELCEFATEKIQHYIRLLIGTGAQVICVLEPAAVMLGPDQFKQFSSDFIKHISTSCRYNGVDIVYHTCGNTMHLIEKMVEAGVNGISLDSEEADVDLSAVAERVPENVAIIGNINPTTTILNGNASEVGDEVETLLQKMDAYPNFILSTGCDLPQETPLENIDAFMTAGRNHRIKV